MKTKLSASVFSCLSVVIAFFFCVFIPINAYINNAQEYPLVDIRYLLMCTILYAVIVGIGIGVFLWLMHRMFPRVFPQLIALLFGITVAFYIQGNLINLDYGILDGHEIKWEEMHMAGILNSCVWVCVLLAFMLFSFAKKFSVVFVFCRISLLFLVYQILVTSINLFNCDFQKQPVKAFNFTGMDEIAKDGGVYVMIFDSFDSPMMDLYLEKHPEARESLSDFTYFNNVIGRFSYTHLAVPHIITGIAYNDGLEKNNESAFLKYKNLAFVSSEVLKRAADSGMGIGIYTGAQNSPSEIDRALLSQLINVDIAHSSKNKSSIRAIYSDSVFIYLPHFLKRYSDNIIANMTYSEKKSFSYSMMEAQRYFRQLIETGRFRLTEGRTLKFLHFNGVHLPDYDMVHAEDSMLILERFVKVLKQYNVYERSKIIVIGDHGVANRERPIVLYNNSQAGFVVDDAPHSFDDLNKLILRAVENDKSTAGDFPEHTGDRLYVYGDLFGAKVFVSNFYDNAGCILRDVKARRVYTSKDQLPSVGIEWDNTGRAGKFWTLGKKATISIPIVPDMQGKMVLVNFQTEAWLNEKKPNQKLEIYFNGNRMGEYAYIYPQTVCRRISIPLPASVNTSNCLRVDFCIDTPVPPCFFIKGSNDPHPFGIAIREIRFDDQYSLVSGFSHAETSGVWSDGDNAEIICIPPAEFNSEDMVCEIDMLPYLVRKKHDSQGLKIFVGQELVYDKTVQTSGWAKHVFPVGRNLIDKGLLRLRLQIPDAISPKQLNQSQDPRALGFRISGVRITSPMAEMRKGIHFSRLSEECGRLICGFSSPEQEGVWSVNTGAVMRVLAPSDMGDSLYSLKVHPFICGEKAPIQRVRILAAGREVYNSRFEKPGVQDVKFKIPRESVSNGWVELKIETPDAVSPASVGYNSDQRKLGIFFHSCKIETVK